MPGIVGYGVNLPYYRIKFSDIAEAWNKKDSKIPGEKTVPAPDETPLTMGRTAATNALEHANIPPAEIGAVYFCSISSMIEGSLAQDIAIALDLKSNVTIADLHGSPRSFTMAIQMCLDALQKRIKYGVIIGSDILVGGLGTGQGDPASEYVSAAGAGALILGNEGTIADFEATTSYMTGLKERWRDLNERFPRIGESRFIRDFGYVDHVVKAGKALLDKTKRPINDFQHIILQQPHAQWIQRALEKLGVSKDALKKRLTAPGFLISKFGDIGAACLPVALAEVFDNAQPEEKILTVSYGSGGSDALSWIVKPPLQAKKAKAVPVEKFLKYKEYVNYVTMLRYNKVISQIV